MEVRSICRKVGGVGGSVNLGGHSNTLKVEGKENIRYNLGFVVVLIGLSRTTFQRIQGGVNSSSHVR